MGDLHEGGRIPCVSSLTENRVCMHVQEPMRAEEVRVNHIEAVEDTGDFLCVMTGNMCPHSQRIQVRAGAGVEEGKGPSQLLQSSITGTLVVVLIY